VLDVTAGHAPPYRFAFLLEKARQYANTVQSLGGQLLAALEKRDAAIPCANTIMRRNGSGSL
jgi:hypothetical protein